MGVKRQRIGQLIADGELLTEVSGKRTMVIDCKFNVDRVKELCGGSGNWNRVRTWY